MNVASPKVGMKRSEMSVSSLRYDILSNPSEEKLYIFQFRLSLIQKFNEPFYTISSGLTYDIQCLSDDESEGKLTFLWALKFTSFTVPVAIAV